jgi:hypothetical protein
MGWQALRCYLIYSVLPIRFFSFIFSRLLFGPFLSSIESWRSITWAHRLAGRFSFILAPHLYQVHQIIDDRSNRFIVSHKTSIGFYRLAPLHSMHGPVRSLSYRAKRETESHTREGEKKNTFHIVYKRIMIIIPRKRKRSCACGLMVLERGGWFQRRARNDSVEWNEQSAGDYMYIYISSMAPSIPFFSLSSNVECYYTAIPLCWPPLLRL